MSLNDLILEKKSPVDKQWLKSQSELFALRLKKMGSQLKNWDKLEMFNKLME